MLFYSTTVEIDEDVREEYWLALEISPSSNIIHGGTAVFMLVVAAFLRKGPNGRDFTGA